VNIRHARAFEKEREQGLIHLNCDSGLSVPVSRKNLPKLRAALGI
jgi:DNA-binding LytR/AlgR family response regulator